MTDEDDRTAREAALRAFAELRARGAQLGDGPHDLEEVRAELQRRKLRSRLRKRALQKKR